MTKRTVPTVGDKVRAARVKKNMSQYQLAQEAGLRPEVISRIETGKSAGSLMSLHRVAPVLGISLEELTKDHPATTAKKGKTA